MTEKPLDLPALAWRADQDGDPRYAKCTNCGQGFECHSVFAGRCPIATVIATLTADRDQQARRADAAHAERDTLRAQLDRAKKRLSDLAWREDGNQWGR